MAERTQGQLVAGRYRIEELLGGTDTEVYRATDEVLGRTVAVKLARTEAPGFDPERFGTETRMLARLRHPGLVTLHDAGTTDGRPYLVMQYVSGPTLAARLRSWQPAEEEIRRIGIAVAGVLDHLHAHGVIHRDVKPGNLLLGDDGQVYLADLGIARDADTAELTAAGLVIGTPAYLAPEQVAGRPVGPACDLYALGLVLLECFTGRREYRGMPLEAAVARLSRPPDIPATLPAPWPELLAALTAPHPAGRPTARAVVEWLTAAPAARGQPPTGQPPTGQPPTGQPPTGQPPTGQPPTGRPQTGQPPTGRPLARPPGGRRRWARLAAAVAGAAAGVAMIVAAWSGLGSGPPAPETGVAEPALPNVPDAVRPAAPLTSPVARIRPVTRTSPVAENGTPARTERPHPGRPGGEPAGHKHRLDHRGEHREEGAPARGGGKDGGCPAPDRCPFRGGV